MSLEAGGTLSTVTVIVKDERGNAIGGQPLAVSVSSGGSIAGAPSTTQNGPTSIGSWRLGSKVGANTITITSGSLPALTVSVQGVAGPPAKITAGALAAVGTVGAMVSATLTIADAFDNPIAGLPVQLAVDGGGALASASTTSDANGGVVAQWTLGTRRGTNTLRAIAGSAIGTFSIVAQADVPASIQIDPAEPQTAPAGSALPHPIVATVLDRFGNGVPRQSVAFTIAAGGGVLTGAATAASDTNGVVTAPGWELGKRNVPQQMAIAAGGARGSVDATIKTSFKVEVRFLGTTMTDAQKAVFTGAAARVTAAITQGAPPVSAIGFSLANACGLTGLAPLSEVIDGIVIYAGIGPIDGNGKILAQAGPCGFRSAQSGFLPGVAVMQFDEADLDLLANGGSLEDVATHEMFHSIGFGTLWTTSHVVGAINVDPRYVGANGLAGCLSILPTTVCGTAIPVENTGGPGTAGGHWRESTFRNELMTGYLNTGANPLSAMSISSMRDIGYAVSVTAADPFSLTTALRALNPFRSPDEPWERLLFPASAAELEPSGGLLMRSRKQP